VEEVERIKTLPVLVTTDSMEVRVGVLVIKAQAVRVQLDKEKTAETRLLATRVVQVGVEQPQTVAQEVGQTEEMVARV
jgi:hypothetical protein